MTGSPARPGGATFTEGSIMRHVAVMTATGSVGLMAIFLVDVINLFYISLLGEQELAAAIGYAGTLMFFLMSISIGLTIGVTAKVSRSLGAGDRRTAARQATSGVLISAAAVAVVTFAALPYRAQLLAMLGAEGETLAIADGFLAIVLPATPVLAIGMALSGVLRAVGDARRAMYVTLAGGVAIAILDPILIFGLDLGVTGAAIASAISRFVMAAVGLHGVKVVHGLLARPSLDGFRMDARPLFAIAMPAILTNLATPVGNAYVTASIADFGVQAVAAWAVIGRLFPLAFGGIFALSGSIGGIFGQNLGAGRFDRVERTLDDSLIFTLIYVCAVWLVLGVFSGLIADAFRTTGEARDLIVFFCVWVAPTFLFTGALFVANAAFNNLGFATWSTGFNWARSTLGIVPFCWVGAEIAGAAGVIAGWGIGGVVFGIAAVLTARRVVRRMALDRAVTTEKKGANGQITPAAEGGRVA